MNRIKRVEMHSNVVNNISTLIRDHLMAAAYEQYSPDNDPDKSDSLIAD